MLRLEPPASERACVLTTYPSSAASLRTRVASASLTPGLPARAREAVAIETPAASATSISRTDPSACFTGSPSFCVKESVVTLATSDVVIVL